MRYKAIVAALAATIVLLALTTEARAWGAFHAGYTHVGPNGAFHYGRTAAVGPYGAYSGGHVSGFSDYGRSYGGYNAGGTRTLDSYSGGGAYHYSTAGYGGYSTGGFRAGGFTDYGTGVYRRW